MTDIPTDESEREYRAMIAILDIAARGERTLSASFAGHVRDELARLRAEKAELLGALIQVRARFQHFNLGPDEAATFKRVNDAITRTQASEKGAAS